jgi:hypothetical protein
MSSFYGFIFMLVSSVAGQGRVVTLTFKFKVNLTVN